MSQLAKIGYDVGRPCQIYMFKNHSTSALQYILCSQLLLPRYDFCNGPLKLSAWSRAFLTFRNIVRKLEFLTLNKVFKFQKFCQNVRYYFCVYLVFFLFANSLCHWSCAICRPQSLMLTYVAARRLVSTCGFTPSVHFGSTNPVLHICWGGKLHKNPACKNWMRETFNAPSMS